MYPHGEIDAAFEDHRSKDEWRAIIFQAGAAPGAARLTGWQEVASFRAAHAPAGQPEPKYQ